MNNWRSKHLPQLFTATVSCARVAMAGSGAHESSVLRYVTGSLASMGAVTISNPIEVCSSHLDSHIRTHSHAGCQVVKTRMQLQGELKASGTNCFERNQVGKAGRGTGQRLSSKL